MLKHYLKIAIRNLTKNKVYSLINILGLAVGLACCTAILAFVLNELSYDGFHEKKDQIYRVTYDIKDPDFTANLAITPTAVLPTFRREFPEVVDGARLYFASMFGAPVVKYEEKIFQEELFCYADSSFFNLFSFPLLKGNPHTALTAPYSLVLSESTAKRYFDDEDPMGKAMTVGSNESYIVRGIMEDMPQNAHFHSDIIASFSSTSKSKKAIWGSANYYTYLLLAENADPVQVETKIDQLVKREFGEEAQPVAFHLQSLNDIYLHSNLEGEIEPTSDYAYILIFSGIAFLVLLIACINYMNLTTARSLDRAKEVGLKKVFGANREQVIGQFLSETAVITLLALGLSMILLELIMPFFNQLLGKEISIPYAEHPWVILGLLGSGLVVSLIAGAYPAFAFTSFKPALVLKGSFKNSSQGKWVRRGLVVFQFTISIVFIICTLAIQQQLEFMQMKKLGYAKDQLVALPMDGKMSKNLSAIKNEFLRLPQVTGVTATSELPTQVEGGYTLSEGHSEESEEGRLVSGLLVDKDVVTTLGLEIMAGENYTATSELEEDFSFIVNEEALKQFGWTPEEAIGKKVNLHSRKGYIQAVTKNFHTQSLHKPIQPVVMFLPPSPYYSHLLVRVAPGQMSGIVSELEATWKQTAPHRPFDFVFLDDQYSQLYQSEARRSKVFWAFAIFAIIVACMGLFGLASFTVVQRAKEIGIRKVMGASVTDIVTLLSSGFTRWVIISFFIAVPIAWIILDKWMENFAFNVGINGWIFTLAGVSCLAIAWFTISFQSIKAAMTNPVEVLRNE